jgi:phosphatidate cytidylyltransferase
MKRVLTAIPLILLLIVILEYLPPIFFSVLVVLVATLALEEYWEIASKSGFEPYRWPGHFLGLSLLLLAHLFSTNFQLLFFSLILTCLLILMIGLSRGNHLATVLPAAAITLMGLLYITLPLALFMLIRINHGNPGAGNRWVLWGLMTCWFSDTAAFCAGKLWGRHKLAPRISPKKTWEGAIGGCLSSGIAAVVGKWWLLPGQSLQTLIILSLVLGLLGQMGDLTESTLKRGSGVKDSSNLLPGHGGMLDRIDAVLFAAPLLYSYLNWFVY